MNGVCKDCKHITWDFVWKSRYIEEGFDKRQQYCSKISHYAREHHHGQLLYDVSVIIEDVTTFGCTKFEEQNQIDVKEKLKYLKEIEESELEED